MRRRTFLQTVAAAAGLIPLLARARTPKDEQPRSGEGPFSGDEPTLVHRYLRDGEPIDTPEPDPGRTFDVIVVGGGMAGVAAAYQLRNTDFLLLEKDRLIGGVSKMESWQGIDYPIGAAYMGSTEPGSPLDEFYRGLGLDKEWRVTSEQEEALFADGAMELGFWSRNAEFTRVRDLFKEMLERRYPPIPFVESKLYSRRDYEALDRTTLADWLARGQNQDPRRPFPPLIVRVIDTYCRAAFCCSSAELSAWAGLNFLLADLGQSYVLPGGNARVVEKMAAAIDAARPGRLLVGKPVVRVRPRGAKWLVTTVQGPRKFSTYQSRAVIVASPKFAAAHIVEGMPSTQQTAISQIATRPYLVVNALLERPVLEELYGGYTLSAGPYTDLGVAEFAMKKPTAKSVITLYHPICADGQRWRLLDNTQYASLQADARATVLSILKCRGLQAKDIADIKLTRWGHALPYPKPGQLSAGLFERASTPQKGLWYAGQDSDGAPCIESAVGTAFTAAEAVKKFLG